LALARTSPPTGRALRAALIATGAALLAAVGTYLAFSMEGGSNDPVAADPAEEAAPVTPAFDFELTGVDTVAAGERGDAGAVRMAARDIGRTLSGLYREAFLNPANLESGDFGPAWDAFDTDARASAIADAGTLTLQPAPAGAVLPGEGTFSARILLDRAGTPATAVATVRFTAESEAGDTVAVSEGRYFLRPTRYGWLIYAYQVDRPDPAAAEEAA
jgi:hypothetical protein